MKGKALKKGKGCRKKRLIQFKIKKHLLDFNVFLLVNSRSFIQ